MGTGGNTFGGMSARGLIAWMLLVLVLLRAAIPVGFMPDLQALRDGRIEIVICTPSGLKSIAVPADVAAPVVSEDGSSNGTVAHECPFDAVISQAILPADPVADVERSAHTADGPRNPASTTFAIRSLGPPLGSRAPPV